MPRQGFFFGSELLSSKAPISSVPKCGACGLYRVCKSPKQTPVGQGKRRILLVGEAPGAEEDKQGEPFVGPMGKILRRTLQKLGVDMRRDCWITNALICRPPKNEIDDHKKIDHCRPNLINTIKKLQPELIIPLGGSAVTSLLGWLYKDDDLGSVSRWAGFRIPEQSLNAWICPTWHPSYVYRTDNNRLNEVLVMYWEHHLEQALKLKGRPWSTLPDYESQVEKIYKAADAAKLIRYFHRKGGVLAFDYEANRLKPDNVNRAIVSCSICWQGKRTIAFPWNGEVQAAMSELLWGRRTWKVASNKKFEDRWTRRVMGHRVRNWLWDTMVNAHLCDNRRGITSIKFQAFVRLGAQAYESHIKPFLGGKKAGVAVNQILDEISIEDLLLYNGLDSLYELKVALKQMKQLGTTWREYAELKSRGGESVPSRL
jgi:uracil-DNA glycosylase family 4